MVKLNKIYTRTGDAGDTGLVDGSRIGKDQPRIHAIGEVDELNSIIGVALCGIESDEARMMLGRIQNELFDLGADLATPEDVTGALRIAAPQIERLEREIDDMNGALAPLTSFILPGGGGGSAAVHHARSAARRAERAVIAASRDVPINPLARVYLNRLSDHLFVLARWLARDSGGDILWQPGATRDG